MKTVMVIFAIVLLFIPFGFIGTCILLVGLAFMPEQHVDAEPARPTTTVNRVAYERKFKEYQESQK